MNNLLKAAEDDYKLILYLWDDIGDERTMRVAMFHFQQAIEKLLEALIVESGGQLIYTCDISCLIKLYPNPDELPSGLDDLAEYLTAWRFVTQGYFNLLTDVKTLEECKAIYSDLHELVLSITTLNYGKEIL